MARTKDVSFLTNTQRAKVLATFGQEFRRARATLGYSQAKMAEALGISRPWLVSLETGADFPATAVLLRLLHLTGCDAWAAVVDEHRTILRK